MLKTKALLFLHSLLQRGMPWRAHFEALGVRLGQDVAIPAPQLVNLYGCSIGRGTKIGPFVEIQKGATVGENCKISSHTFVCEGVHIGNGVFVGHGVTFINDRIPRALADDGALQTAADWEVIPTVVSNGASIGSGATLLCGITVGSNALVGAGAVVVSDVPANAVVAGNPAKVIRMLTVAEVPSQSDGSMLGPTS